MRRSPSGRSSAYSGCEDGRGPANPPRSGEGDHAEHGGGAAQALEQPLRLAFGEPPPRVGEELIAFGPGKNDRQSPQAAEGNVAARGRPVERASPSSGRL